MKKCKVYFAQKLFWQHKYKLLAITHGSLCHSLKHNFRQEKWMGKKQSQENKQCVWQKAVAFTVLSSFWRKARDLQMKSFCAFNTVAKLQGFLIV